MVNNYKINVNSVICVGDTHGELMAIAGYIKQYDLHDTAIIVCGDVGIGFMKKDAYIQFFHKIKKTLSKYNCYLILVRGNHDKKEWFDGETFNDKRVKAVPDYSVLSFYPLEDTEYEESPYNVLCVGGAISIDRIDRIAKNDYLLMKYWEHHFFFEDITKIEKNAPKEYWEDEYPVYNEEALNELKNKGIQINGVVTHTAPSFCPLITKDGIAEWMKKDENLYKDLYNERNVMDMLYNKLKNDGHPLTNWCYGHFHQHQYTYIDGIKFIMLDMVRKGRLDGVEIACLDERFS